MVDPIKAMNDAAAQIKVKAQGVQMNLTSVKSYCDEVRKFADRADAERKAMQEAIATFDAAFTLAVEKAGLTSDKAKEHLHAIAAVIKLAEASGVKLAPEIDAAPIIEKKMGLDSSDPWAAWHAYQSEGDPEDCHTCSAEFDLSQGGWKDDAARYFCSIECFTEVHSTDYYPTIPYQEKYKTSFGRGSTGVGPHAHNLIRKIRQKYGDVGWLEYVQKAGFYRPSMHAAPKPKPCASCKMFFNLSEMGWKISPGIYACSTKCASNYGELTKNDSCVDLFAPNYLEATPTVGIDSVGCTCDFNDAASWVTIAMQKGWSYPKYVSKP